MESCIRSSMRQPEKDATTARARSKVLAWLWGAVVGGCCGGLLWGGWMRQRESRRHVPRTSRALICLAAALCFGGLLAACSSSASSSTTPTGSSVPLVSGGSAGSSSYLVYWDQNEEEDFSAMPSGTQGQLIPAWDPNGRTLHFARRPHGRGLRPNLARAAESRKCQALQATSGR